MLVDSEHLRRGEFAFVDTARTHREAQRFALDHRAQVAARAEQPAASVKAFGDRGEVGSKLRKTVRHAAKDAAKCVPGASLNRKTGHRFSRMNTDPCSSV